VVQSSTGGPVQYWWSSIVHQNLMILINTSRFIVLQERRCN